MMRCRRIKGGHDTYIESIKRMPIAHYSWTHLTAPLRSMPCLLAVGVLCCQCSQVSSNEKSIVAAEEASVARNQTSGAEPKKKSLPRSFNHPRLSEFEQWVKFRGKGYALAAIFQ
jgi:hypothetical protein